MSKLWWLLGRQTLIFPVKDGSGLATQADTTGGLLNFGEHL